MQANEDDRFVVEEKVAEGFCIFVAGVIGVFVPPKSAGASKQECLVPFEKLTWQALKGIVVGLSCSWITAILIYL